MRTRTLVLTAFFSAACSDASGPTVTPRWPSISAGISHTCALDDAGRAYCWGSDGVGQLGDGPSGDGTSRAQPAPVVSQVQFAMISAHGATTCGITTSGRVYCWGDNTFGQLGIGDATIPHVSSPEPVAADVRLTSISVGPIHVCAIATTGAAFCWGDNVAGQTGTGPTAQQLFAPTAVSSDLRFSAISAGRGFTCAVATGGAAYCWGYGVSGQLGAGTAPLIREVPTPVAGDYRFRLVSAGDSHACGLTLAGGGLCWGRGGALGIDASGDRPAPVAVHGDVSFISIGAGSFFSCGTAKNGAGLCWGGSAEGALGSALTLYNATPLVVDGGHTFSTIATGMRHACGVTTIGAAYCWGANDAGQLGDGTTMRRTIPTSVVLP